MSEGLPQDKQTIDNVLGDVCLSLENLILTRIPRLAKYVSTQGSPRDTYLTGLGYTPAEITDMHSLATVLSQVAQVFQGAGTIPNPVDIMSFLLPFTGPN